MKVIQFLKEHRQFTLFGVLAIGVMLVAVFAPFLAPKDPLDAVMSDSLLPPGGEYLCGTDKLGRDVLSHRVLFL